MLYTQVLHVADPPALPPPERRLYHLAKKKQQEDEEDEDEEEKDEVEEQKEVKDEEDEKVEEKRQKDAEKKEAVRDEEEKVVKREEKQTLAEPAEKPARKTAGLQPVGDPEMLIVSVHLGLLWIAWCNSGGSSLLGDVLRAANGFLAPFVEALKHLLHLERLGQTSASARYTVSSNICVNHTSVRDVVPSYRLLVSVLRDLRLSGLPVPLRNASACLAMFKQDDDCAEVARWCASFQWQGLSRHRLLCDPAARPELAACVATVAAAMLLHRLPGVAPFPCQLARKRCRRPLPAIEAEQFHWDTLEDFVAAFQELSEPKRRRKNKEAEPVEGRDESDVAALTELANDTPQDLVNEQFSCVHTRRTPLFGARTLTEHHLAARSPRLKPKKLRFSE